VSRKRQKYRGILDTPLSGEDGFDAYWKRILALFDHYGIKRDPGDSETMWLDLAMALARDHVRGFHYQKAKSRFDSNVVARDYMFVIEMEKRLERVHSIKRAAEFVVKKHPDFGFQSAEAARVRYQQLTMKNPDSRAAQMQANFLFIHEYCKAKTKL
jgi:hypothetical protein